MKFLNKIDLLIEKICASLLVASILSILFFSSLSIILRWFQINLMWIEPFVRHLVFLGTFLGGVIATGKGTHIGIDLISKLVEVKGWKKVQVMINRMIYFASSVTLFWLVKAGYDFTKVEFEFAKVEFLGIKSGYLVAMIPIGSFLIAIRFLIMFFSTFDSHYTPVNIHTNQGHES